MAIELDKSGLAFWRQKPIEVLYDGIVVGEYVCDFVVEDKLVLELKALSRLMPEHEAQVLNYLKATRLSVALLFNFGVPRLGIKRIVLDYEDDQFI